MGHNVVSGVGPTGQPRNPVSHSVGKTASTVGRLARFVLVTATPQLTPGVDTPEQKICGTKSVRIQAGLALWLG